MSPEAYKLLALRRPAEARPGDMWLCRRLGIVRVMNGHKRGQSRRKGLSNFHLYHWQKPCLLARPCDWRDNDPNGGRPFDPDKEGEAWEYVGNLFEVLPYASILAAPLRSAR